MTLSDELRKLADSAAPLTRDERATARAAAAEIERLHRELALSHEVNVKYDETVGKALEQRDEAQATVKALSDANERVSAEVETLKAKLAESDRAFHELHAHYINVLKVDGAKAADQKQLLLISLAKAERDRDLATKLLGDESRDARIVVADLLSARAEAAALREALERIKYMPYRCTTGWEDPAKAMGSKCPSCVAQYALAQPGPGTALLEELKRLRAVADAARRYNSDDYGTAYEGQQDIRRCLAALEAP